MDRTDPWPVAHAHLLKTGNPDASVGVCTLWSKKETLQALDLNSYAVVGNLYSFGGINGILRNLRANPNIRHLILCGADLSKTGDALSRVWKEGVGPDRKLPGFPGAIEPEIPLDAVDLVRKNVTLHDLRPTLDVTNIQSKINTLPRATPYAKPEKYAESQPKERTLPSELTGIHVRGDTLASVWLQAIQAILQFGEVTGTQYGNRQKEVLNLHCVIENEPKDLDLPAWYPITKQQLESYLPDLLTAIPHEGVSYTYGQLLRTWKGSHDQIEYLAKVLAKEPTSRHAVAVIFDPLTDNTFVNKQPPCLTQLNAAVRRGKLWLTAHFRSHDYYRAWPQNLAALRILQQQLADTLKIPCGSLSVVSHSAHLYEDCWNDATALLEKVNPQKVTFTEDARGNFVLTVADGQIIVEHVTPAGPTGIQWKGTQAREIRDRIATSQLATLPQHWLYLGMELQRAQDCLEKGQPYTQDEV